MRVIGFPKPKGAVKAKGSMSLRDDPSGAIPALRTVLALAEQQEHTRWDPKDGELCLVRLKSGETLMEDRSDSDVQIDRRSWV